MWKLFGTFILVTTAALMLGYQIRLHQLLKPCAQPIIYTVGTFDKRFDLSQTNFLRALKQAEEIWEKASGLNLFDYSLDKAAVSVNLVYDERQEVTEALDQIEEVVKGDEATYKSLEKEYKSLKSEEESVRANYNSQVKVFDQHNTTYEQMVGQWNASDRTSKAQFDQLETARRALEQELAQLKSVESQLNALVRQVNAKVATLNQLARHLNLNVNQYNTVGASRGETFTGGTYTSDDNGERIDIYEFENHTKLVRVLAHELGHALGLDHVSDPEAVMYYLNESDAEKLTEADLTALKILCKIL